MFLEIIKKHLKFFNQIFQKSFCSAPLVFKCGFVPNLVAQCSRALLLENMFE